VQRGVLGVDRDQLGAGGLGQRHHEVPADDERLLVGERDVDALRQRHHGRAEAGRADDRVEHEIGVGLGHEPHQPLGPGEHLALRPQLGGAGGGVAVAERDAVDAVLVRERHQRLVRALGRQPHELELVARAGDDVERLGTDGAGRAEDQEPFHRRSMMAGAG
jgi:hypothetical protein